VPPSSQACVCSGGHAAALVAAHVDSLTAWLPLCSGSCIGAGASAAAPGGGGGVVVRCGGVTDGVLTGLAALPGAALVPARAATPSLFVAAASSAGGVAAWDVAAAMSGSAPALLPLHAPRCTADATSDCPPTVDGMHGCSRAAGGAALVVYQSREVSPARRKFVNVPRVRPWLAAVPLLPLPPPGVVAAAPWIDATALASVAAAGAAAAVVGTRVAMPASFAHGVATTQETAAAALAALPPVATPAAAAAAALDPTAATVLADTTTVAGFMAAVTLPAVRRIVGDLPAARLAAAAAGLPRQAAHRLLLSAPDAFYWLARVGAGTRASLATWARDTAAAVIALADGDAVLLAAVPALLADCSDNPADTPALPLAAAAAVRGLGCSVAAARASLVATMAPFAAAAALVVGVPAPLPPPAPGALLPPAALLAALPAVTQAWLDAWRTTGDVGPLRLAVGALASVLAAGCAAATGKRSPGGWVGEDAAATHMRPTLAGYALPVIDASAVMPPPWLWFAAAAGPRIAAWAYAEWVLAAATAGNDDAGDEVAGGGSGVATGGGGAGSKRRAPATTASPLRPGRGGNAAKRARLTSRPSSGRLVAWAAGALAAHGVSPIFPPALHDRLARLVGDASSDDVAGVITAACPVCDAAVSVSVASALLPAAETAAAAAALTATTASWAASPFIDTPPPTRLLQAAYAACALPLLPATAACPAAATPHAALRDVWSLGLIPHAAPPPADGPTGAVVYGAS